MLSAADPLLLQQGLTRTARRFKASWKAADGRTPLHCTALGTGHSLQLDSVVYQGGWGRDAAAALLLDAGCPADALDNNGCSALHYAAGARGK